MNDLHRVADTIENLVSDSAKDSLLRSAVIVIKQAIDRNTHWQSVKDKTTHQVTGNRSAVIRNEHHAGVFLEEGTKDHPIAAKNAKALRFMWNGRVTFRKSVHHPGTKATRFWSAGADTGIAEVDRLLVAFGDQVFLEVR